MLLIGIPWSKLGRRASPGAPVHWIQKHLDRFEAVNPVLAGYLLFPSPLWVFFQLVLLA